MVREMTNSEKFLAIYNELDDYMRKELKEDTYVGHTDLIYKMARKGNNVFKCYGEDLKKYARLRNAIVHNPEKRISDPLAEPHEIIVSKYQDLLEKVLNPPLAINSIAVLKDDMYTTTLDANVLEIMKVMNKKTYTHVPIIEDGKLIGVFSENTIFSYITQKENVIIDDELKISDFIDFIPIHNHVSEIFVFVPRDITVIEIEDIFREEFENNKRISAIFITQNGKENEKLLGLITPWDVAGNGK